MLKSLLANALLMGWIKANADYLVFVGLWTAVFAIKNWWLARTGRQYAIVNKEWLFAAVVFVCGWVLVDYSSRQTESLLGVSYDPNLWIHAISLTRIVAMVLLSALLAIFLALTGMINAARFRLKEVDIADEALRSSQQKLLFHVKRTPLAVIEMNRNSEITEWNAAAEQTFGYTHDEAMGQSAIDLIVPENDRTHVQQVIYDLIHQQGGTRSTNKNLTKDGRVIECEWFNTPLIDNNGEPIGSISLCQDITERERAAAAIENLAAFPRLNPNPVLQFSSEGELVYCNDAAQEMAKSFGKENIVDLLPENAKGIIRDCIAGGEKFKCETKLGERTISWTFFPIGEIHSVHCYAGEITERLSLEAQLRHSQKMESVGHLAAGIAHDFNNILVVIQGHSELLALREQLSPPGTESLHQISTAAERAAGLTQQLLAFGRKQSMQVQPLDLNEVVCRVSQMLKRVLGAHITLRTNCGSSLPALLADPVMMEQIVMNLAVNARDAMPNGGSLIIGTTAVNVTRAYKEHHPEAREGPFVCLNVSDNGTGIEPEKLGRLFEPFFTTKQKGKGTGLGLATVYGIVNQHNGWIEVESALGKGTTFKVFLPASAAAPAVSAAIPPKKAVTGGNETILLVEDEIGVLELARNILKTYGYKVLEAHSGAEALRVWEQHSGDVDLLFVDIVLPDGISGVELADKLLLEKRDLVLLFTSGYNMDVLMQDFCFKETMALLKKPYAPHLLAQKVRECLDLRTGGKKA